MNSLPAKSLTFANGLRATVIHAPGASRAAALLRIARGSHDEPEAFPGLAHFIEHLLFLCGERFVEGERLHALGAGTRRTGECQHPRATDRLLLRGAGRRPE